MKYIDYAKIRGVLITTWLTTMLLVLFSGCKKDFGGYYDPPKGLVGPIYEQLKSDPDFSEFVAAIDKFPLLKDAINSSGLYTVFAPTNDAIKKFLADKYPSKNAIADFDMSVSADSNAMNELVQMHIIYNMYYEYDFNKAIDILEQPDAFGQFSGGDVYRYTTRFKDNKYWFYDSKVKRYRLVRRGNKMITVYSANYLNKYDVSSDYQALYGIAPSDFNIEGAQVIASKKDVSAKNGVIHAINKVLEKRPFIDQTLAEKNPQFFSILDKFAMLTYDEPNTIAEASNKANPDSLFTKNYGGLFLGSDNLEYTVLCPANSSFLDFVNQQLLPGFDNSYDSIPLVTASELLRSYVVGSRTYSKNITSKVINLNGDTLSNIHYTERIIASNGLVYLVSDDILSPAFKSVAKVPLMNKNYSWFLSLLAGSSTGGYNNYIQYLKNPNQQFTLFVPSNRAFKDAGINYLLDYKGEYDFYKAGKRILMQQKDSMVNNLILVGQSLQPSDFNTYKWLPTRSGNYMMFNKGYIQGNINYTTYEQTENGSVFTLDELPTRANQVLGSMIMERWPNRQFDSILISWTPINSSQTFINMLNTSNGNACYTVLFPTDSALQAFKTANGWGYYKTDPRWATIAEYYLIKTKVFSDGTFQQKANNPLFDDPSKFVTQYAEVVHDPGNIFEKNEYSWIQLNFSGAMTATSKDGETTTIISPFDLEGVNGVIHFVNKVVMPPARLFKD